MKPRRNVESSPREGVETRVGHPQIEIITEVGERDKATIIEFYFSDRNKVRVYREQSPKNPAFKDESELIRCLDDPHVEKVLVKSGNELEYVIFLTTEVNVLKEYTPTQLYVCDEGVDGRSYSSFWECSDESGPGHYSLMSDMHMFNNGCLSPIPIASFGQIGTGRYRRDGTGRIFIPKQIRFSTINKDDALEMQSMIDGGRMVYSISEIDINCDHNGSEKILIALKEYVREKFGGSAVVSYTYLEGEERSPESLCYVAEKGNLVNDTEVSVQTYWVVGGLSGLVGQYKGREDHKPVAQEMDTARIVNEHNIPLSVRLINQDAMDDTGRSQLAANLMEIESSSFYVGGEYANYHSLATNKRNLQDQRWTMEEINFVVSCKADEVQIFIIEDDDNSSVGLYIQVTPKGLKNPQICRKIVSGNPEFLGDTLDKTIYIANIAIKREFRGTGSANFQYLLGYALSHCPTTREIDQIFSDTAEKLGNTRLRELLVIEMHAKLLANQRFHYAAMRIDP